MFFVEGVVLLLISDFFSTAMIDLFLALKIILTTLTTGFMAINVPNGCRHWRLCQTLENPRRKVIIKLAVVRRGSSPIIGIG